MVNAYSPYKNRITILVVTLTHNFRVVCIITKSSLGTTQSTIYSVFLEGVFAESDLKVEYVLRVVVATPLFSG